MQWDKVKHRLINKNKRTPKSQSKIENPEREAIIL